MILVSLRDTKAETWSNPHVVQNKAAALREFGMLVNDRSRSLVAEHPADFELYQVAEIADIFDGVVKPCTPPLHLASGVDVRVAPPVSE